MRIFVTITTIRYSRMLGLVTEGTVKFSMFGLVLGQHFKKFGMTSPAVFGFGIISILDIERAVWFMTA